MEPGTVISILSGGGRLFKAVSIWWTTRRLETLKDIVEERMREHQTGHPAPRIFELEHLTQVTSAPTKRLRRALVALEREGRVSRSLLGGWCLYPMPWERARLF